MLAKNISNFCFQFPEFLFIYSSCKTDFLYAVLQNVVAKCIFVKVNTKRHTQISLKPLKIMMNQGVQGEFDDTVVVVVFVYFF